MRSDTGESLDGSGGLHGYVIARDGSDAERFLTTLHERCWLHGLGWIKLGAAGQMLERSIIDRSVAAPERLVFEAAPILAKPLKQDHKSRRPIVHDGDILDTLAACPPLTPEEQKAVEKLKAEAKERIKPQAESLRASTSRRMRRRSSRAPASRRRRPLRRSRADAAACCCPIQCWSSPTRSWRDARSATCWPIPSASMAACWPIRSRASRMAAPPPWSCCAGATDIPGSSHSRMAECHTLNGLAREKRAGADHQAGNLVPEAPRCRWRQHPIQERATGHQVRGAVGNGGQAATALIAAKVPFYQRGNKLVRPVVVAAQTFHGRATTVAQLVEVELPYLRDTLCRNSRWFKFDMRSKKWLAAHPHKEASLVLLKKFGDWKFPVIAGIITTPTLRPDGTILSQAGYDPATRLLLIDPPDMPEIPEQPTKADALAALELLSDLLVEFRFDDDGGVSRAVALSAMVSTVCRGAYPVLPMHVVDAPAAGSGKSYLLSLVSLIATGQEMPVLGSGKDEVEMEKRIGAELIHGQTLICIDNVVGELGGQALCQLIEQHRPSVRVLGKSQNVEARGTTFFANGNNIIIVGDLYRRVVRCRLDTKMERPEERNFQSNPKEMILADRGKYIAACLTIVPRLHRGQAAEPVPATWLVQRMVGYGALGAGVAG